MWYLNALVALIFFLSRCVFADEQHPGTNDRLMWGVEMVGTGSAVPSHIVQNVDLEKLVNTSDEWISTRTGIRERRILLAKENLQDLAGTAAQRALTIAGVDAEDIDMIIVATSTPDDLFGDATAVAAAIGAVNAVAWDLTAACSGFVFALINASQFLSAGTFTTALVVGADAMSRWVDWRDRETCILFGDGAGAAVLKRVPKPQDTFLSYNLKSDPTGRKYLRLPRGVCSSSSDINLSSQQGENLLLQKSTYADIGMHGREVFRFVSIEIPRAIRRALVVAHLTTSDIDWFILHQANDRILQAVASRLDISKSKMVSNISKYGNTSAASIPLALDEVARAGLLRRGDKILLSGFGAGLSWGVLIFTWVN